MQDQRRARERDFVSFAASASPRLVSRDGETLAVRVAGRRQATFAHSPGENSLRLVDASAEREDLRGAALSALEAAFAWGPQAEAIALELPGHPDVADSLARRGATIDAGGRMVARPYMLMQQAELWLAKGDAPPYPARHVLTRDCRHPMRPPKPEGVVYARYIPWLERTLTFRAARAEADLPTFHRWMNDERVAAFWNETGDLEAHRRYLDGLVADPHMIPMMGAFDDVDFAYFEIYWAKENRLAPFYDADDYDRGWHVAVGEASCRGAAYIGAWLPSLLHFMFLDEPRTRRIVGEPATAHSQQIRNLERSGFTQVKTFDFPHKRATLVSLSRERFFAEGLWRPAAGRHADAEPACSSAPLLGAA
jgi:RimJ/RimL family protein N-acetyltransferase